MTTHVEGDKDQDLLGEKGGNGFPFLIFMDADGNTVAHHEGQRTSEAFLASLATADEFSALRKKAAGGDAAAKLEVFMKDLEFGNMKYEAAKAAADKLGDAAKEKKAEIDGLLAGLEYKDILAGVNKKAEAMGQPTPEQIKVLRVEAGKGFTAMLKAGHVPAAEEDKQTFYMLMLDSAEDAKDAATFEKALAAVKEMLSGNPQAGKFISDKEEILKTLKGNDK
ncbi:MAG: hypothetical protein K8T20_09780 [Planctomycetes bacterium]|nr:hypothetical protein [Planctomycetota bacterium]